MSKTPEELFVSFHYAEVKDLAKQFLTLIAGTLVISITFADKIIPLGSATKFQKWLLGASWCGLLVSFTLAGLGLFTNYLAAEQAQGGLIYDYRTDFRSLVRRAYGLLDVAAVLFAVSLLLLAITGLTRFVASSAD